MWPFRRKQKPRQEPRAGKWIVYNIGTELEFGECQNCGYEVDSKDELSMILPEVCPGCRRRMDKVFIPDEDLLLY